MNFQNCYCLRQSQSHQEWGQEPGQKDSGPELGCLSPPGSREEKQIHWILNNQDLLTFSSCRLSKSESAPRPGPGSPPRVFSKSSTLGVDRQNQLFDVRFISSEDTNLPWHDDNQSRSVLEDDVESFSQVISINLNQSLIAFLYLFTC